MSTEAHAQSIVHENVISFNMKSYRIILTGIDDEIVYVRKFKSYSDARAIIIAENMFNGLELDLWEGERFIRNIAAIKYY